VVREDPRGVVGIAIILAGVQHVAAWSDPDITRDGVINDVVVDPNDH
jgi:hypothetical protein